MSGRPINRTLRDTPYPFHVLGTQGLQWSRCEPSLTGSAKRQFLGDILEKIKKGVDLHPSSKALGELIAVLEREILYTVTVRG